MFIWSIISELYLIIMFNRWTYPYVDEGGNDEHTNVHL